MKKVLFPLLTLAAAFGFILFSSQPCRAIQLDEEEVIDEADIDEVEETEPAQPDETDTAEAADDAVDAPAPGTMPDVDVQEDVELPQVPAGDPKYDPQWSTVPPTAPAQITVESGDTLWDLCEKYLGNSWFWPKVWGFNKHIPNPHWIYPGNVIKMRPDDQNQVAGQVDTDATAASMRHGDYIKSGGTTTIDLGDDEEASHHDKVVDSIVSDEVEEDSGEVYEIGGPTRRQQYAMLMKRQKQLESMRRDGFVSTGQMKASGEIVNSPHEKHFLIENDKIYIDMKGRQTAIGESYQIYRIVKEVEHPVTGDDVGYKIRLLGRAQITRLGKPLVTAKITSSYTEIERGDFIRPWKNPYRKVMRKPNKTNTKGYVIDRLGNFDFLGEWNTVYLDKGVKDGIEEGNELTVIRRKEGLAFVDSDFENEDLPAEKVATLLVLSAGSRTSVAVIRQSFLEVGVGDMFVMRKSD